MANIEMYFNARENVTPVLRNISNDTSRTNKDLRQLQRELNNFSNKKVDLKTNFKNVQNELKDMEKNARKTGQVLGEEFRNKTLEAQRLEQELKDINQQIKENERATRSLNSVQAGSNGSGSAPINGGGSVPVAGGFSGTMSTLAQAGLFRQVGDSVANATSAGISSAFGTSNGNAVNSVISGAIAGATLGSVIPGVGTLIGGAVGTVAGGINAVTQKFTERDDRFKEYTQANYNDLNEYYNNMGTRGSAVAGQREKDKLSFDTLLKHDSAEFLKSIVDFSTKTPFAYDDLTKMSKSALTGFNEDEILGLVQNIGDAGASLDLQTESMDYLVKVLARMNNSNKFSLENYTAFQDRGIKIGEYLSEAYNMSIEDIFKAISKGQLKGQDVVEVILANLSNDFGGAMEKLSETYDGLMSTYQDSVANLDAIAGEAYNEGRKEQINKNKDLNESSLMAEMATYKGAYQAEMENMKDEFRNNALKALEEDAVYQSATAEEKGRMIMEAETRAKMDYMETSEYKAWAESQIADYMATAGTIKDYGKKEYYSIGQEMAQAMSRGYNAYNTPENFPLPNYSNITSSGMGNREGMLMGERSSHAYGLTRVPFNGYRAELHENEMVLTASEARAYKSGKGHNVTITGNSFVVREEADITKIARQLATELSFASNNMTG